MFLSLREKGLKAAPLLLVEGNTLCVIFQRKKDEWKRLADGLSERNLGTEIISYCDHLYAFPSDGKGGRYDPVVNGWSTLDLSIPRSTKVAVVSGEIYAIEINTSTTKSTVKRYDFERYSWQPVLSSHEGCRELSCVVAAGNHLYVCGGVLEDGFVTKAERFDTVGNKWEEIASMQQKRGNAFGVASERKIFVAGGRLRQTSLKTCEMFNVSTNEWQFVGSLNVRRMYGSMLCLKGTLYVLGGEDYFGGSRLRVECYDPTENKWIQKTTIPENMISKYDYNIFTSCVLKLSNGVLDKLDVIKE